MTRYIARRLIQTVVVVLAMSFVCYGLLGLMPGDPIDIMVQADPNLTPADAERLKALYGLDRPIVERYGNWLGAAVGGDFGYSRIHNQPALAVLGPRLWNTIILMSLALALSLALAVPIGVYSALRPYSKIDYTINFLAFAGISIPVFWLALVLIIVFAVILGWLPAGGMGPIGDSGWLDRVSFLILPVVTLSLANIGSFTRFMRAATMEVMRQDFVRTARAKGLPRRVVIYKHALRNSLIPVVTILALSFGSLFSGALVTETIFSYLGMGKLIYDSILGSDYNLAMVGLMFATILVLLSNLAADLCYAWLDPRVSYR